MLDGGPDEEGDGRADGGAQDAEQRHQGVVALQGLPVKTLQGGREGRNKADQTKTD